MADTEELTALIEAIPARTLAAKLRALMPVIERRIQAGVRHGEIVDVLNKSGALPNQLKLEALRSYLKRYRKAQRGETLRRPRQAVSEPIVAAKIPPPGPLPAGAPLAVTPAMLRQARNKPIDLELLSEIGRSTIKKKGL